MLKTYHLYLRECQLLILSKYEDLYGISFCVKEDNRVFCDRLDVHTATYIATNNPSTIITDIDEILRLRAENKALKEKLKELST